MKSNLIGWGVTAMMLGGLLWILAYGIGAIVGVTTGELPNDPGASAFAWLGAASFSGAIFFVGFGLAGLYAHLERHSKKLAVAGLVLSCVAIITAAINLVLMTGILGDARILNSLGGVGVLSILGGTTLLAIAALRAKVLPRWTRVALLFVGVLTFPVLLATIPLESVLPPYVIADLPFAIVGVALIAVGYTMLTDRGSEPGRQVRVSA